MINEIQRFTILPKIIGRIALVCGLFVSVGFSQETEAIPLLFNRIAMGNKIEEVKFGKEIGSICRPNKEAGDRRFYFGVNESRFKRGNAGEVEITLRYRDQFKVPVSIVYGEEGKGPKKTELFTTGESGEWKEHRVTLLNPYFGSDIDGSDLLIVADGAVDFVLGTLSAQGKSVATIIIPDIFSSGMVVQQKMPIKIWGWSKSGVKVGIEWDGVPYEVTTEKNRWTLSLPALDADGKKHEMKVIADQKVVREIKDIQVGEVWLASGQSNMHMGLGGSKEKEVVKGRAPDPLLRCFNVPTPTLEYTREPLGTGWSQSDGNSEYGWSAVGYHFVYRLREALAVPVALINVPMGATFTESWCSPEVLAQGYPRWEEDIKSMDNNRLARFWPSYSYEHFLKTVIPYSIRGVIWYQGEANTGRWKEQERLFPAMVEDWRRRWSNPTMPFYFVQLPRLDTADWHEFRNSQRRIWEIVPNSFMAVTIDIAKDYNVEEGVIAKIHPTLKQPVGERLALGAKKLVYGLGSGAFSGPRIKEAKVEGAKIKLTFDFVGKGLKSLDQKPLRGFAVGDAEGKFTKAEAAIEGDLVVLSSYEENEPKQVRYAAESDMGQENLDVNLGNEEGLPASPFTLTCSENKGN